MIPPAPASVELIRDTFDCDVFRCQGHRDHADVESCDSAFSSAPKRVRSIITFFKRAFAQPVFAHINVVKGIQWISE